MFRRLFMITIVLFGLGRMAGRFAPSAWAQEGPQTIAVYLPLVQAQAGGAIQGDLGYPAGAIPAMEIHAIRIGDENQRHVIATSAGQHSYTISGVAPGDYFVVAYAAESGLAGGYTRFVACGMPEDCQDHSLKPVTVQLNQTAQDIDLRDWPLLAGTYPPQSRTTGVISGELGYPSEFIPAMKVYAINVDQPGKNFWVQTVLNQGFYAIQGIEPGRYHVVGYPDEIPLVGGYTQYVACGMGEGCSDHSLVPVQVEAGELSSEKHIRDWPLEVGTYPPQP